MAKSTAFDQDFLKMTFQATPIANLCDNAATGPLTNLYVALHTADPGVGGTQSTSEITYVTYARQAVLRSSSGWTLTGTSITPVAAITFPPMVSGTGGFATFWSVGVAVSGATKILYSGAISPTINVSAGVTPQLTVASTITES